jgi:hypothetical protein
MKNIILDYYFYNAQKRMKYEIYLTYNEISEEIEYNLELGRASSLEDGDGGDYKNNGIVENKIFNELYGKLLEINIENDIFGNYFMENEDEDFINFDLTIVGLFGEICYNLSGVNKRNIEKKGIRNICNIVKKILEITNVNENDWKEYL